MIFQFYFTFIEAKPGEDKPKVSKSEYTKKLIEDGKAKKEKRMKAHENRKIEIEEKELEGCVFKPTLKSNL